MKIFVSTVFLAACSFGFDVPVLPNGEFHDVEVSTLRSPSARSQIAGLCSLWN